MVIVMSIVPIEDWLASVESKLSEVEKLADSLENLLKIEEYRRRAKVIEREYYKLEIVVIPASKDELDVKIYCTPRVNLDPKYIFLIYLTEFFPEVSTDFLDPEKSRMYTSRIVMSFKMSPEFFEMDMRRILGKIHKFWTNLMDDNIRKQLDDIIPRVYELIKSKDADAKRELSMLKMKINDLLLYE